MSDSKLVKTLTDSVTLTGLATGVKWIAKKVMNTCWRLLRITININKMASISIMIGEVLINATAFVGGTYLAEYLSGEQNIVEEERKSHDLAVEKHQG